MAITVPGTGGPTTITVPNADAHTQTVIANLLGGSTTVVSSTNVTVPGGGNLISQHLGDGSDQVFLVGSGSGTIIGGSSQVTVASGSNNFTVAGSDSVVFTSSSISTVISGGGNSTVTAAHDQILTSLVLDVHKNLAPAVTPDDVKSQSALISSIDTSTKLAVQGNSSGETIHFNKVTLVHTTSTFNPGTLTTDASHQTFALLNTDGSYAGVDSLVGANDFVVDATGSAGYNLFAVNLAYTGGTTVDLKGVDSAILAAAGTVQAVGSNPILITSDNQAQNITGGDGNDTLVGTGNDTLTGGAGSDLFAVNASGHYTITDFNKSIDKLAVEFAGVGNIDQLNAKVTSVIKASTGVTYNFGPDTSVTLVGVSASDLTANMLAFKIIG